MRYRHFRDHAGRWHKVEMTQDEIIERVKYWLTVAMVSVATLIGYSIAAGII